MIYINIQPEIYEPPLPPKKPDHLNTLHCFTCYVSNSQLPQMDTNGETQIITLLCTKSICRSVKYLVAIRYPIEFWSFRAHLFKEHTCRDNRDIDMALSHTVLVKKDKPYFWLLRENASSSFSILRRNYVSKTEIREISPFLIVAGI